MIKKIRKNNDISNAVNSCVGSISIIFMTGASSCGAEARLIDLRCRNYCNGNFCRNEIHFPEETRIQKINSCLWKHWHLLPFQQCFRQILFKIKESLPPGSTYKDDFASTMHLFCWEIWYAEEKSTGCNFRRPHRWHFPCRHCNLIWLCKWRADPVGREV